MFFILSGFFTAMLWRKRGLRALIGHRVKRIFLPLVLGLATIIPATWIVTSHVKSLEGQVADGKGSAVQNQIDVWATAAIDDVAAIERSIEAGQAVDAKNPDDSTALHIAAFFGRAKAARALLDAGARPDERNKDRLTVAD